MFDDLTADIIMVPRSIACKVHVLHAYAHHILACMMSGPFVNACLSCSASMCCRLQVVPPTCRQACLATLHAWPVMLSRTLPVWTHR